MSIDRQYGRVVFICDRETSPLCDDCVETGEGDFRRALDIAKTKGWRAVPCDPQPGGGFMHVCPRCTTPR